MTDNIAEIFGAALDRINRQHQKHFTLLKGSQTADDLNFDFPVGDEESAGTTLATINIPLLELHGQLTEGRINWIEDILLRAHRERLYAKAQAAGDS